MVIPEAPGWAWSGRQPTAMSDAGTSPTASTSRGSRPAMCPSAKGSTIASARRSPRLEARVAFEELFKRIPDYAVIGPTVRGSTPSDRLFESLPVEF